MSVESPRSEKNTVAHLSIFSIFARHNISVLLKPLKAKGDFVIPSMGFNFYFVVCIILVFIIQLTCAWKCYLTGSAWPKDCSFLIHERHRTNPACLFAVVLDGK